MWCHHRRSSRSIWPSQIHALPTKTIKERKSFIKATPDQRMPIQEAIIAVMVEITIQEAEILQTSSRLTFKLAVMEALRPMRRVETTRTSCRRSSHWIRASILSQLTTSPRRNRAAISNLWLWEMETSWLTKELRRKSQCRSKRASAKEAIVRWNLRQVIRCLLYQSQSM